MYTPTEIINRSPVKVYTFATFMFKDTLFHTFPPKCPHMHFNCTKNKISVGLTPESQAE